MKIRNIKGLTQKELADKMESNQGYISGIERNEYNPTFKMLNKICEVLDITVVELIVLASNDSELAPIVKNA